MSAVAHDVRTGELLEVSGLVLPGVVEPPGVSFCARPGELVAVQGLVGSGRTTLLLALAGRLRVPAGQVRLGGFVLPDDAAAVRRQVALGLIRGVNDLDDGLTIGHHLRERRLWLGRRRVRAARADSDVFALVELDREPRTRVSELRPVEQVQLGVALALVHRPVAVVVDDADADGGGLDRAQVWRSLRRVADEGVLVVAACHEDGPGVDVVVQLPMFADPVGQRASR